MLARLAVALSTLLLLSACNDSYCVEDLVRGRDRFQACEPGDACVVVNVHCGIAVNVEMVDAFVDAAQGVDDDCGVPACLSPGEPFCGEDGECTAPSEPDRL